MPQEEWISLGDKIKDIVEKAVDSQDFNKLNQSITRTINNTMEDINRGIRNVSGSNHHNNSAPYDDQQRHYTDQNNREPNMYGNKKNTNFHNPPRFQEDNRYKGVPPYQNFQGSGSIPRYQGHPYKSNNNAIYGKQNHNLQPRYNRPVPPPYGRSQVSPVRPYRQAPLIYKSTFSTQFAGWMMGTLGGITSVGTGITMLFLPSLTNLIINLGPAIWLMELILLPIFIVGLFMTFKGISLVRRSKRFNKYIRRLKDRTYCSIKELADSTGQRIEFVQKDVRKMIEKGWFVQGHVDQSGTNLMVTNETYQLYLESEQQYALRQQENTVKKDEPVVTENGKEVSAEVAAMMKSGREYIEKIRRCNDAIPGEEVSDKITQLEIITQRIFQHLEKSPDLVGGLEKFMEYYLPTTLKLLEAYELLDGQPIQGENITTAKKEIEDSLDTIILAFENMLDGFFKNTAWDISTDISVLNTMLAQEGLTKKDF